MNAELIIEKIRDSIENYEVFKKLALDIRFRKADRQFYTWGEHVDGMIVHMFRFADAINEDNIVETITQCRLMRMADNEEWEDDFWDSRDDRLLVLNSPICIRDDLIIKEVILKPLDTDECLNSVRNMMNTFSPVKDIFYPTADTQKTIFDIIRKSQHIELGKDDMVLMWLSVSEDTVLTIEQGGWD